jgi:hypothetical protein
VKRLTEKSFSTLAYELLFRAGPGGMHYKELTKQILKLRTTKGKTPDQTVLTMLERDEERFEKVDKGVYRLKGKGGGGEEKKKMETEETEPASAAVKEASPGAEEPAISPSASGEANGTTKPASDAETAKGDEGTEEEEAVARKPSVIEALMSTAKFLGATAIHSTAKGLVAKAGKAVSSIVLGRPGLRFDVTAAKTMFGKSGAWIPTHHVELDQIKELLPPDTVSPKAHRAQVWTELKKVFDDPPKGMTIRRVGRRNYTEIEGEVATVDTENRLLSCTCDGFNAVLDRSAPEKKPFLCRHLLLAMYHNGPALADEAPGSRAAEEWREAFDRAGKEHADMKANVMYYFIKNVIAISEFNLAACKTPKNKAVAFVVAGAAGA